MRRKANYERLASLFTPAGELRIPDIGIALAGQAEIRSWAERVPTVVRFLIQNSHAGSIRLDGDAASGRTYVTEVIAGAGH